MIHSFNSNAQDYIVLLDKTQIPSKIENLTDSTVNYIDWVNLEGPTESIFLKDVAYIQYKNGDRINFNKLEFILPTEYIRSTKQKLRDKSLHINFYSGIGFIVGMSSNVSTGWNITHSFSTEFFPSKYKYVSWSMAIGFNLYELNINPDNERTSMHMFIEPLAGWRYDKWNIKTGPKISFAIEPEEYDRKCVFSWTFTTAYRIKCVEFGGILNIGISNLYSDFDSRNNISLTPYVGLYF